MRHSLHARAAGLALAASLAVLAAGCSKKAGLHTLIPNERPTVDLTAAPASTSDTAFYAYRVDWSGYDPDGRVDHYQYMIDPPKTANSDTAWVSTTKNEQILFFRSTQPYKAKLDWRATDFHTFVIRAVDNLGAVSAPKSRSFYSYTIAPTVSIISPIPSAIGSALVTPAVRIQWLGSDPDGQFTQKPIKYKFKLLKTGDPEFDLNYAKQNPDSLRLFYAKTNFAGWDSTSAETTQVQYANLTPNAEYLFIVIGYDEAGAYSPDFNLNSNILDLVVGLSGTLGPTFTLFNEFFFYPYSSGGFTPTDPLSWIQLEVPAGQLITFNWFATPDPGAEIEWYRWKVDGDVGDETPRTNETTDWYHWSNKSNLTNSCTIGPFPPPNYHFLYVEAQDNNGIVSLATVHFLPVKPTFDKDLLIVNDTRLEVDKFNTNGTLRQYNQAYPSATELDTFLFARGGYPWRKAQVTTPPPVSPPGVFNGYPFDTLGTRQGYEIATAGVPYSRLGQYKHLIWMTDVNGGLNTGSTTDPVIPQSTLHYMCTPPHSSTLSAYAFSGGEVWLLGGAAAYASLIEFNAKGAKDDDRLYGVTQKVFNNSAGELVPGRIMYDGAHWRSEMIVQQIATNVVKSAAAVGGWSNPGWKFGPNINAPDYSLLPAQLRARALALGDTMPPSRLVTQGNTFYTISATAVEYLDLENDIQEDIDPSPANETDASVLDTLYELRGGQLVTNVTEQRPAVMTYYHGVTAPKFVFTGVDIWSWSKQDCVGLVDFVLGQIWGLNRSVPRTAPLLAQPGRQNLLPAHQPPASRTIPARLPVGRSREKG